jgi:methylase of polypeptide subunit release factors
MNTAALKAFAPVVRRQLLEAVSRKLDYVLSAQTPDYLTTYAQQVVALRKLAQEDRTGLIERVAYTWFNRLTALRYLDARGWHPFHCRVLTATSAEETQPEVLKLLRNGTLPSDLAQHTNLSRLNDLLDGRIPSFDAQGEVYRHLALAACRFYHALLPNVFERLDDKTELLLPDDLLTEHSVVQPFRTEITDEDCAEVEIIGWLYQFYISERKDEVMARRSAVPKQDVPAVTQLFTPHWIVRYLVENSLGRLWLINRPGSLLRARMPYYIDSEIDTPFHKIEKPEDIKLLDPACGSGHILAYAFDLLFAIYEEDGYSSSDIPGLIFTHNLHGMDICPRATQLAELTLLFKARERSRLVFRSGNVCRPLIYTLHDVQFTQHERQVYAAELGLESVFTQEMIALLNQFGEAATFGSLINPCLGERAIKSARQAIQGRDLADNLLLHNTHSRVAGVLEQAEAMTPRYDIVVTNPPYMGGRQMNAAMKTFAENNYLVAKADLFAMFMERGFTLTPPSGFVAMITMQSWMYLSSFEDLREQLLSKRTLLSMAHFGARAFDAIGGEVVQATSFVAANCLAPRTRGVFFRLTVGRSELEKAEQFRSALSNPDSQIVFRVAANELARIPGCPIAYWASDPLRSAFSERKPLSATAPSRPGLQTGDNSSFVRLWFEVGRSRIGLGFQSREDAKGSGFKWFPYNKGGTFRRWFGNCEFVIDWLNDGERIKRRKADDLASGRITANNSKCWNQNFYFRPSISWSKVSGSDFAARLYPAGFLFDIAGCSVFFDSDDSSYFALGFLNSVVTKALVGVLSETINFEAGNVAKVPFPSEIDNSVGSVIPKQLVDLSRRDWDNVETSWDFRDHPLLKPGTKEVTLEGSWLRWKEQCEAAILRMQELEVENNRLFIAAYRLQEELSPEVPFEQVTLARADKRKDVAAFLSYAVGCMMGRYSLDHPGLILANAGDSMCEFLAKVDLPKESLTLIPSEDGIIPVLDGDWFENDIVTRTREFLRATFGEATLRDNIRFIEDSIGKDLRKYFLTDFYKDHLQNYKKRPIYWMVQSPKKSFSVLVYLHRYTRDTMNLVLNRYLREYEVKLRNRIDRLTQILADAGTSTRDRTAARKESDKLIKALHDCEEWERQTLLPLAQERIELDLDDGVKVNYLKLGEALAPIPGLAVVEE